MLDPIFLSDTLFDLDPFHTGCQSEKCDEEYDIFSNYIVDSIASGLDVETAIRKVSEEYFGHQMLDDYLKIVLEKISAFGEQYGEQ